MMQVVEELFTYWNLDDADQTLEELEDALIVSSLAGGQRAGGGVGGGWAADAGPADCLPLWSCPWPTT